MNALAVGIALVGAALFSAAAAISPAAILVPAGLLLLWASRRSPVLGLTAAIASFPLQRSLFGMPAYAASATAAALAGVAAIRPENSRSIIPSPRENVPQYLAVGLVAYTFLSLCVRASIEQGGTPFPDLLATEGPTYYKYILHALILFLLLSITARSEGRLRRLAWIQLVCLVPLALLGIEQAIAKDNALLHFYWGAKKPLSLIGPDFAAVTSVFFDKNRFGNYLVSTFFVCLPLLSRPSRGSLRTVLAAGVLALALACLFLSQSVANWTAFVIGMFTWLALRRMKRTLAILAAAALLAVLLIANLGAPSLDGLDPRTGERLDSLLHLDFSENGPFHIRLDLLRGGMEMFHVHPLFGTGYGGFQPAIGGSTYFMNRTKGIVYSHNSYVLILAELGIAGLLLTGAFLGSCVAAGHRALVRAPAKGLRAMHAGLLAAVAANLVFLASYDSILYNLCLWVPLGMMVGGARACGKGGGAASRKEEPVSGSLRAPRGAS